MKSGESGERRERGGMVGSFLKFADRMTPLFFSFFLVSDQRQQTSSHAVVIFRQLFIGKKK